MTANQHSGCPRGLMGNSSGYGGAQRRQSSNIQGEEYPRKSCPSWCERMNSMGKAMQVTEPTWPVHMRSCLEALEVRGQGGER